MRLHKKTHKKILVIIFSVIILLLAAIICIKVITIIKPTSKTVVAPTNITNTDTPKSSETPTIKFDKSKYSTTNTSSVWLIVNKSHPLSPIDYAPDDLITTKGATIRSVAQTDFDNMMNDASAQNIPINVASSYRSYATQKSLYNSYVTTYGQTSTDTFSARPGYSEHQTGLAIDFGSTDNSNCNFDDCYATTSAGKWLAANASNYGFILRYTAVKQPITGFKSEPWHYRYVGRELAAEMKAESVTTLEEFFDVSGGETYYQ